MTTTPNRQDWKEDFEEKFVISSMFGRVVGHPNYLGNEDKLVEDIEAFFEKVLAEEKRKIGEEILKEPDYYKLNMTDDQITGASIRQIELQKVINSLSGKK